MGIPQNDLKMEGWLYTIRSNRFGLQFSRKRYFILEDNNLRSYKKVPISQKEVFFVFTLQSTLDHNDQLKLGAISSEEAGRWMQSLQAAVLKECPNPEMNFQSLSKRRWPSLRLGVSKWHDRKRSIDFQGDAMTSSDVVAPSPWKIFGCQNGIVNGTSEEIFKTVMSLGPSRSEWDFCFFRGSVVEHIDGHTDIVHEKLYSDWLPRGMKRRDLLLQRYWRREEDGTYGGGYVITPVHQGRESLVKHMLAVDWKFWRLYRSPSSERSITIRMLERVAALREYYQVKAGVYSFSDFPSGIFPRQAEVPEIEKESTTPLTKEEIEKPAPGRLSLMGLNDASDEFFDVPDTNEEMDAEHSENGWPSDLEQDPPTVLNLDKPRLSSAAVLVKKLHDLAVQKKGYVDLQESAKEDSVLCSYGNTLQKDPTCSTPCTWTAADPTTFLIRGENYLKDHKKVKAKSTLMQMVGADWLRSERREDELSSRHDSIVQKYAAQGRPEFFFVVNIQVPAGPTMHTLALYYMLKTPIDKYPLLHNFVNGDNAFRNSRFKLIPYISQGSWIVKQSVGKKSCLIGQALDVLYFRGSNYLEVEIDVSSSTVARGVVSLVLGYLTNLVIEMAFVIQGNTEEELPELLLGTCRLNHLDATKTTLV
ncbi:hypothetical protein Tsubulata_029033 [Turnera subulata]|uniref:PH domain-containing protein n=1 Tax=Turnera subulata TaxID=218843 RepID=A0A9Q0GK66_9ROSI|nr:hypothetical protein Tsubulata_029033 [Turnera subulata]